MEQQTTTLDLTKRVQQAQQVILDLSKQKGIEGQQAKVCLVLDDSGSMQQLYMNGYVQRVLERVVPIAMQFDDNQTFETFLFSDSCRRTLDVNMSNIDGVVTKSIYPKCRFNGTNYAPAIRALMDFYIPTETKGTFMGFGGKIGYKKTAMTEPVFVIFLTDGDNSDHRETEAAVIEASAYGLFFKFIGLGSTHFNFLKKLDTMNGRVVDNANFIELSIADLTDLSDRDLYERLLTEYPEWLGLARGKNIIV